MFYVNFFMNHITSMNRKVFLAQKKNEIEIYFDDDNEDTLILSHSRDVTEEEFN